MMSKNALFIIATLITTISGALEVYAHGGRHNGSHRRRHYDNCRGDDRYGGNYRSPWNNDSHYRNGAPGFSASLPFMNFSIGYPNYSRNNYGYNSYYNYPNNCYARDRYRDRYWY